jgi:tRNA(Ile)-lysidine synthetase-like protein
MNEETRIEKNEAPFVARVAAAIQRDTLIPGGATVLVGVSGGPDSMALLALLRSLAPSQDWRIEVAHLDHRLRGGSAADAAFVDHAAAQMGLRAVLAARDVAELGAQRGWSLEVSGRQARYAFLARVAADEGADVVAVAHHADDQVETVLMNIVRGAGLTGLAGMDARSHYPLRADEIVSLERMREPVATGWPPPLVRPLLDFRKQELVAFLARNEIAYREDPTNADMGFLRNRIRHQILPLLEEANPRVREAILRTAALARDDRDFIGGEVDAAWSRVVTEAEGRLEFAIVPWEDLSPALQRRLLRRAVGQLRDDREVGLGHIEAAREHASSGATGSAIGLPGGLRLTRSYTTFELVDARASIPRPGLTAETRPLEAPVDIDLPGGWRLRVTRRTRLPADPAAGSSRWQVVIDAAAGVRMGIRGRRPGDSLEPMGMGGRHKSLQDLFVDARVPRHLRAGWPVIVADDDVLWVPGLRMDARARVRPGTTEVLEISVTPPADVRLG